jgi:SAM-dependent methyltransferase
MLMNRKGAGTGGATKSILKTIGQDFASYTYTDISTGFFETAESTFAENRNRMVFKAFNAEHDPVSQGFSLGSYDLVVASFVIHATSELEVAMRNVRRLLRPGGYAVLAESTNNDQTRAGFIFGTLPGWWSGVDEGRVLSPCVSAESWDATFRRTGFSGIDTITPEHFERIYAGSVIVAQAVDDHLTLLREPLTLDAPASSNSSNGARELVVLGGSTLRVARLVTDLKKLLKINFESIITLKRLEDAGSRQIDSEATILSLVDLDKPIFKDINSSQFEIFKKLFLSERTILWVTKGRRAEDPFSNMVVGFGRTAIHETPGLRLQFLDFESAISIDSKMIAETLVRFQVASMSSRGGDTGLLWSIEPEIVVDGKGRQLIPRQLEMAEANDRYNSARRAITRDVDLTESDVEIFGNWQGSLVRGFTRPATSAHPAEPTIKLQATHSMESPVKTCLGHLYLILGVDKSDGTKHIALAGSLASTQLIPKCATATCELPSYSEAQLVCLVAEMLLSASTLQYVLPGQSLLVHNPTPSFARCLYEKATSKGIKVWFTTESEAANLPTSWTKLFPNMTKHNIQQLIPKHVDYFLSFRTEGGQSSIQKSIVSALPRHCHVETSDSIFPREASAVASVPFTFASRMLQEAITDIKHSSDLRGEIIERTTVRIEDVAAGSRPQSPWTIVDWRAVSPVSVHSARLDSKPLFQADKTYWLIGLSGTLGLSLCDWMIDHGAAFVVISSRNPGKIDPVWVEINRLKGATVKLFAK